MSLLDMGVDLDISGIPTGYSIAIKELPKINIGLDKINIGLDKINIGLDPIEIKPIDLSIRIKEIPSVRVSLPADFKVCIGLFGVEMASVRLCGQGQIITEPYVANPCECRGSPPRIGIAALAATGVAAAPAE